MGVSHLNKKRLFNSIYKDMESSKNRRKIIRGNITKKDDKEEDKDGESYAPRVYKLFILFSVTLILVV